MKLGVTAPTSKARWWLSKAKADLQQAGKKGGYYLRQTDQTRLRAGLEGRAQRRR